MTRTNTTRLFLFTLGWLLLFVSTSVPAATITASIDRNPVSIDESFNLRLKAKGSVDADPDLTPLRKDFDVISTSQSSSMNYINGNFSREAVWNITLISKAVGIFTIPSIAFGKDSSPSIRITVNDAGTPTTGKADRSLFLEVETDTKKTWVQSQILYTIRLFRNVTISNASLSQPETSDADAIIEQLGDDVSYEAFRNGVRYDVIERRYAIFPQHSGQLQIKPIRFEGRLGGRRSMFDAFNTGGKIKRSRSKRLLVDIDPIPTNADKRHWLPARQVSLHEEWSAPTADLQAGEPVTRTITIQAEGMMANFLPDITPTEHDSIKQYPDQPLTENKIGKTGVVASKRIKIAMIPSVAGRYTLPEIKLPWWNSQTGRQEVSIIPAQTITVSGSTTTSNTNPPAAEPIVEEPVSSDASSTTTSTVVQVDAGYWPWISLFFAGAWVLTLILLFRSRSSDTGASRPMPLKKLQAAVLQQCAANDAPACKDALLDWAKAAFPEQRIHNLMDIVPQVDEAFAHAIRELNSALYGDHAAQWQGTTLADALKNRQPKSQSDRQDDLIEPLYRSM